MRYGNKRRAFFPGRGEKVKENDLLGRANGKLIGSEESE